MSMKNVMRGTITAKQEVMRKDGWMQCTRTNLTLRAPGKKIRKKKDYNICMDGWMTFPGRQKKHANPIERNRKPPTGTFFFFFSSFSKKMFPKKRDCY